MNAFGKVFFDTAPFIYLLENHPKPALKSLDALQLATAINSGCDHFFTNDYKLKRIPEINILIVDEL